MENGGLELGDIDMMIQDTVQSLLDCVTNERNATNLISSSIQMVPRILRDLSPSSFNPKVVSIGPIHKEDENVQAFEKQKIIYLNSLIRRTKSPLEEILKSCVEKVYSSMDQIKVCYAWSTIYDAEFAKMMVMDACFILEFIYMIYESDKESCFGNMFLDVFVLYDLVLLENQIPFFVLDEIFHCTVLKFDPGASLIKLFKVFLSYINILKSDINIDDISIDTTHHILSLLHQCYKPKDDITLTPLIVSTIPSVVDLDRSGVNFKPNQDPTWLMGMELQSYRLPCFWNYKPILRIPVLQVHDFTEVVLRNLIAYELSCQTRSYVTSYLVAMDMLVNSQEDVAKLVDSRVIVNSMGSNEEAANMINNICKEVTVPDFYYNEQWRTLNEYYNGYWPKNIARLRRTYFSSPWNMIALIAGIVLFILTVIQTIFAIKPSGSSK